MKPWDGAHDYATPVAHGGSQAPGHLQNAFSFLTKQSQACLIQIWDPLAPLDTSKCNQHMIPKCASMDCSKFDVGSLFAPR